MAVGVTEGANLVTQIPPMEQEIAQPAVANAAQSTERAPVEDNAMSMPANYVQCTLPAEILLMIISELPDFDSFASAVMTCKRMYKIFLERQKAVRKLLLQHNGQGFLGCPEATVAMKLPVVDKKAVRNINTLVEVMRVFWGGQPGVSDIPSPHEAIAAMILGTHYSGPATSLVQDLQVLRQESTSHLLFGAPSSGKVGTNDPTFQEEHTEWHIDRVAFNLTPAQAIEMADLGVCVEKLCAAYIDSQSQQDLHHGSSLPEEDVKARAKDNLWRLETFCRLFGGPSWWKRWRYSMYFPRIFPVSGEMVIGGAEFRDLYGFLFSSVSKKLYAVAGDTLWCRCHRGRSAELGGGRHTCHHCHSVIVDGALCMGLAAVCRIIETPVTDLQALKECFAWDADGLPKGAFFLSTMFRR